MRGLVAVRQQVCQVDDARSKLRHGGPWRCRLWKRRYPGPISVTAVSASASTTCLIHRIVSFEIIVETMQHNAPVDNAPVAVPSMAAVPRAVPTTIVEVATCDNVICCPKKLATTWALSANTCHVSIAKNSHPPSSSRAGNGTVQSHPRLNCTGSPG